MNHEMLVLAYFKRGVEESEGAVIVRFGIR